MTLEELALRSIDRAEWGLWRAYDLLEGDVMLAIEKRVAANNNEAAYRRLKSAQLSINAALGYYEGVMNDLMDDWWPHPIPAPEEGVVYGDF